MLNTIMAISFVALSGFSLVKLINLSQQRHQLLTCAFTQTTQLLSHGPELKDHDRVRSSQCHTERQKSRFITSAGQGFGQLKEEFQTNLTLQSYKTAKEHSP